MIGPDVLSIRNASLRFEKTGPKLNTFHLHINGGQLFVPPAAPIDLPDLDLDSNVSFSKEFDIPVLDFGPVFKTSGSAHAKLALSDGVLEVSLARGNPGLTTFTGSDLKLTALMIRSDGTFNVQASGKLQLGDYKLATATFMASRSNNILSISLPESGAANVNLGFLSTKFFGSFDSNGNYSLTGSARVGGELKGPLNSTIASASGTGSFTLDNSGFHGSFSGSVCAGGCLNLGGTISSDGQLTVLFHDDPDDSKDVYYTIPLHAI